MSADLKIAKSFLSILAKESGLIISKYYKSSYHTEIKSDGSPVTIADKKSEEIMREMIIREFPDHGIIGEEFGIEKPEARYKWVLDPIDGTKSFVHGGSDFGTIVALLDGEEPILGMINQPIFNELMIGDNQITELNGKQVRVRDIDKLADAVLLTTDYQGVKKYQNLNRFLELSEATKLTRTWGNCYGYLLVAAGYADIMIDPIMNPWDILPVIPVIRGAGGIVSDYQGSDGVKGKSLIAAAPKLHNQVIKILN